MHAKMVHDTVKISQSTWNLTVLAIKLKIHVSMSLTDCTALMCRRQYNKIFKGDWHNDPIAGSLGHKPSLDKREREGVVYHTGPVRISTCYVLVTSLCFPPPFQVQYQPIKSLIPMFQVIFSARFKQIKLQ